MTKSSQFLFLTMFNRPFVTIKSNIIGGGGHNIVINNGSGGGGGGGGQPENVNAQDVANDYGQCLSLMVDGYNWWATYWSVQYRCAGLGIERRLEAADWVVDQPAIQTSKKADGHVETTNGIGVPTINSL